MLKYIQINPKEISTMKKIFLPLLLASGLFASECTYSVNNLDVEFKAYKTPLKIGVGGTFDTIKLHAQPQATQKELLQHASLQIDTSSVNSKNSARDAKLVKFFFEKQNVQTIDAKVIDVEDKIITVAITMNDITKKIPMRVEFDDDEIEAEGVIDLADFKMLPSLQSINKACYKLHKGKTWQDVRLEFEMKTSRHCH